MFALFEDAGKFQTGRVLSQAEASCQIELESGKRMKVKASHVLLQFGQPEPSALLGQARTLCEGIDLALAWEFAPEEEFGFLDLAKDYFNAQPSLAEQVAALLRLHEAPHYFRRAGKGRFRKASAEVIAQALAAIEKKQRIQAEIDAWAEDLAQGTCPPPIAQQLYRILFKPDKNAPEYKAVVAAARATHLAPLALLQKAGAISSAYQFHWQRFLLEYFPKGTGFPPLAVPALTDTLPTADVAAYSIDDSHTTEIDDALSVRGLGSAEVTVGIHIAAPGLALSVDSPVDGVARQRLSTVYMPGHKITMLPDALVQAYTLQAGRACPAVSLYVVFDAQTLDILRHETRLEQVPIVANLRHDQLDSVVTADWLTQDAPRTGADLPHAELAFLFRLAQHLKSQREVVRGKPENFTRADYTFHIPSAPPEGPRGDEAVEIGIRQRGAPLDLIVAEAMILANSRWGQWLADLGVPAIYRSQASLAPGVKVRMGTKALPHAGIGVPCYAWSTSPLRRYTDLVNQWQIIACARHGATAALAAPFKPKDAALLAIISAFDAAYTAYNGHQAGMERYWTLKHLQDRGIDTLQATVFKQLPGLPPMARADEWPLVFPVLGCPADLPRGVRVRVQLGDVDLISLDVRAQFLSVLDAALDAGAEEEDEDLAAGPIAIAVDVDEAPSEAAPEGPSA